MATKNFWNDRFTFLCANGHKEQNEDGELEDVPIPFIEKVGVNTFYACPKHSPLSEDNPDGFYEEPQCFNNLGFQEATKIVKHLEKEYEKNLANGETFDLTNYQFNVGLIQVDVLEHSPEDKLMLGIVNNRAIHR